MEENIKKNIGRKKRLFDILENGGNLFNDVKKRNDNCDIIESIMKENNVNSRKKLTPEEQIKINVEFIEAIINKNYDLSVLCFNKGGDINYKTDIKTPFTKNYHIEGATPIFYAIRDYDEKVFTFLVKNGADVNAQDENGNTPLHLLTNTIRNIASIKLLVEKGASINIKNKEGINAFSKAIELARYRNIDNEQTINFLIEQGADVNTEDENKVTPLMKIISIGETQGLNLELIKKIITNGANIDAYDKNGKTALHYAMEQKSRYENRKLIKLLIEKGADVNVQDNEGNTPLILATKNYDVELIKSLVEGGALLSIKDKKGKGAIDYIHYEQKELRTILDTISWLESKNKI
jgi:ankyrin repeat protein